MSGTDSPLYLSPNQQNLLVAALTSNQPTIQPSTMAANSKDQDAGISNASVPGSGHLDYSDESPFLDFPLDGEGDESFAFDDEQGQMFGDLEDDGSPDNETTDPDHLHDKRKSMGGQDDDDDEGGGKRREGDDKQAKKPGRKPLTSEPTSKRKAQNRAAQRAFRERKEKHLKDLENKVEDLEKASEATNNENSALKAQVERLQVEVKEYRKRLSWVSTNGGRQQLASSQMRNNTIGSGSSDFQFQFPKFGDSANMNVFGGNGNQRPSQPVTRPSQRTSSMPVTQSASPTASTVTRQSISNDATRMQNSRHSSINNSPMNQLTNSPPSYNQAHQNSVDSLSGLFSPSILEATRNSPNGYFGIDNNQNKPVQNRGSFDNAYSAVPGLYSGSSVSNTESPGSSSDAHNQTSSIGTSPDTNFNSPNNKLQDLGLNTINEEGNFGQWNFRADGGAEFDPSGFNWLAQQNGGTFDPVLFGDYRDTTDNLLQQDFGSFFNEAYPLPDLGSPSHNYGDVSTTQPEQGKRPDLMAKVEAAKESDTSKLSDGPKMMTCNKIWDRLQSMEKFRNGEIDIDNLCSELRAKAKCSEGGAVVEEKHVNKLLGLH